MGTGGGDRMGWLSLIEREGPEELRVREREPSLNPLLSFYSPLFYFWGNHIGGFNDF